MLVALEQAWSNRRTPEMELTRALIRRVDLLWRQTVVNQGGEDPGPLEILLPGEKRPEKPKASWRSMAQSLLGRR